MKRPSFAVVSYCLLALAIFGFMIEGLRTRIPDLPPNRLQYENSEFMLQASRSEVDWWPLEPAAFAEARRTGKPIMLLVGVPWSKSARDADAYVFSDREVVSFLNRYMISIRIDAMAEPNWMAAILPVRRARMPMLSGFQVWFLTPEGLLFHNAGEIGTVLPLDPDVFGEVLIDARELLRAIRAGDPGAPTPGGDQAEDKAILTSTSVPRPVSPAALLRGASNVARSREGGVNMFGRIVPSPNVLRYLLASGRYDEFRRIANDLLASPVVDWLDGGFYRSYVKQPRILLEFDKVAVSNAEMMSILAKASVLLDEPIYRQVAERAFDCLSDTFVQSGIVVGCQIGDEVGQGRSKLNSFKPVVLREILTDEELEVAQQRMGLSTERSRVMSVWLREPSQAFDEASPVPQILKKLAGAREGRPRFAGKRQLDVHGYVVARLTECARLWSDRPRLRRAEELAERLEWFRASDDVRHSLEDGSHEPFLADYLAYADAAMEAFLAFGRSEYLENGARVLRRAKFLFETDTPGVWRTTLPSKEPLGPQDVDVPEVLDIARESTSAQAIRLCGNYGRLLRDADLLQAAQSSAGQFSGLLASLGVSAAGLFVAHARTQDDVFAIVVGPNSLASADRLFRRAPTRLAAPALGPAGLAHRYEKPGVYILVQGRPAGPFSEDEAVRRLPAILAPPPRS